MVGFKPTNVYLQITPLTVHPSYIGWSKPILTLFFLQYSYGILSVCFTSPHIFNSIFSKNYFVSLIHLLTPLQYRAMCFMQRVAHLLGNFPRRDHSHCIGVRYHSPPIQSYVFYAAGSTPFRELSPQRLKDLLTLNQTKTYGKKN